MTPTSMFSYYFWLGLRNLRRNPILTVLIILTLAVGVAASVSTLTILHVMSGNPIPHKSDRLLVPVLDNAPLEGYVPSDPTQNDQLTYKDVKNLLASQQGNKRVALYGIFVGIEPTRADLNVTQVNGLAVSNDYFSMFEVPMAQGRGWTETEEKNAARVVVLSSTQSEKLFGKETAIGKRLRIDGNEYEVIGVIGRWNPIPRYTHLVIGDGEGDGFVGENNLYMPFSTAIVNKIGAIGKQVCRSTVSPGYQGYLDSSL